MEEEVRAERIVETEEDRAWIADGAAAMVTGQ
jgi:hypothetical protein